MSLICEGRILIFSSSVLQINHFIYLQTNSISGKTQDQLLTVWLEEAKAALRGKKNWKSSGLVESCGRTKGKVMEIHLTQGCLRQAY